MDDGGPSQGTATPPRSRPILSVPTRRGPALRPARDVQLRDPVRCSSTMETMRVLSRALALTLPLALVVACSMDTPNGESCLPGDFAPITLSDGGSGFVECLPDGSAYALYSGPDPNTPPDANVPEGGDAAVSCSTANGAQLGFMCTGCSVDSDGTSNCASGLVCYDFPNKGGYLCTRPCTPGNASTVCPPPSAGCGNNGTCKP